MENPLISVIVPIYNAERYLNECLSSLVNQTYKNIEIILVNDGSTDNSLHICNNYLYNYSNIKLVNKINGGPAETRNLGLKYIAGDYFTFLDSDDWLALNTYEEVAKIIAQYDVDAVRFTWTRVFDDNSILVKNNLVKVGLNVNEDLENVKKLSYGLFGKYLQYPRDNNCLAPVWAQVYKKDCLKDIKFTDCKIIGTFEDGLFNTEIFQNINSLYYIDKPFLFYRKIETSFTNTYKINLSNQWKSLYEIMQQNIKSNNLDESYNVCVENRMVLDFISIVYMECGADKSYKNKKKFLKEILNRDYYKKAFSQFDYRKLPIVYRIFYKSLFKNRLNFVLLMTKIMIKLRGKI